jgi:hypothetical protein
LHRAWSTVKSRDTMERSAATVTHLLYDNAAEAMADEDDGNALVEASVSLILGFHDAYETVLPSLYQLLQ